MIDMERWASALPEPPRLSRYGAAPGGWRDGVRAGHWRAARLILQRSARRRPTRAAVRRHCGDRLDRRDLATEMARPAVDQARAGPGGAARRSAADARSRVGQRPRGPAGRVRVPAVRPATGLRRVRPERG